MGLQQRRGHNESREIGSTLFHLSPAATVYVRYDTPERQCRDGSPPLDFLLSARVQRCAYVYWSRGTSIGGYLYRLHSSSANWRYETDSPFRRHAVYITSARHRFDVRSASLELLRRRGVPAGRAAKTLDIRGAPPLCVSLWRRIVNACAETVRV